MSKCLLPSAAAEGQRRILHSDQQERNPLVLAVATMQGQQFGEGSYVVGRPLIHQAALDESDRKCFLAMIRALLSTKSRK